MNRTHLTIIFIILVLLLSIARGHIIDSLVSRDVESTEGEDIERYDTYPAQQPGEAAGASLPSQSSGIAGSQISRL